MFIALMFFGYLLRNKNFVCVHLTTPDKKYFGLRSRTNEEIERTESKE